MYINKNFNFKGVMRFSGGHIVWLTLWVSLITTVYHFTGWKWMQIPWLPLSLIGTAVAFYLGFKNNSAYDRLWEARKIWGAIVNSSRAWGSSVKAFIDNHTSDETQSKEELDNFKKTLIHRHVAWLYALRNQLLIPTTWEHISQNKHAKNFIEKRRKSFGLGLLDDDETEQKLKEHLLEKNYDRLISYRNTATHIIDQQSHDLAELKKLGLIDNFRHMELQKILNDFYVQQGKCERIKKFPLPRQYSSMSLVFVGIFIFLLPFGMAYEFDKMGGLAVWMAIPFTVLVAWVYVLMELIGDYSENPFEGLGNDIPMLSLCRTIEIDLKEMLHEENIPKPVEAINGVLM